MTTVAAIRPDSWNFPLFLHVLGATTVVGALSAVVVLALAARRHRADHSELLARLIFRTLLFVVVPSWILMRVTGQWILSKEDLDPDPGWVGVGFIVSDAGVLFLVAMTVLAWLSTRRRGSGRTGAAVAVLAPIYLVALLVAMFAMSGKPGS